MKEAPFLAIRTNNLQEPVRVLFLLQGGQITGAYENGQELSDLAAQRLWDGWKWERAGARAPQPQGASDGPQRVRALRKTGIAWAEIAERMGIYRTTARRWGACQIP